MSDDDVLMRLSGEMGDKFAMVPLWVLRAGVSDGAKVLYACLHLLVMGREGETIDTTRQELADLRRKGVDTIDRHMRELIGIKAVEKREDRYRPGGQVANRYFVWFTAPEARFRRPFDDVEDRGRKNAAPVEGSLDRGRESAATGAADLRPPTRNEEPTEEPPLPPTSGGGQAAHRGRSKGLRSSGSSPRQRAAATRMAQAHESIARTAAALVVVDASPDVVLERALHFLKDNPGADAADVCDHIESLFYPK